MARLIDLSHVIEDAMPVYPGDMETQLVQTKYLKRDFHNNHNLSISMHSGTHIDSPMHLLASDVYVSELPLDPFIAPGCVLDVRNQPVVRMRTDYEQRIKQDSIVLLYSGHDRFYGTAQYYQDCPCVDEEFGSFLLCQNVKMLGIDWPTPDNPPFPVHKLLLANNVYILENLTNLDKLLEIECFEVIALPLKIRADGSMTRAVARTIQN